VTAGTTPTGADTRAGGGALPYAPWFSRVLPVLDRAFRVANRWYVIPAIKSGLAPFHANPVTGSWMLLRTRGRTSGRTREVALGYALLDGAVYCAVGFGPRSAWYRNILADPHVELVLPGAAIAGLAEEVTDPDELRRGWRALIRALGVLGRSFVCSPDAPDAVLDRSRRVCRSCGSGRRASAAGRRIRAAGCG
jgi:deazaflavin-dependent oxidoreductase (nitroreductase family)